MKLTLAVSVGVCLINAVMGTVVAWILIRDRFRGQGLVNAIIDLPFALPTIVAGLTLLALYGPKGPVGLNIAFSRTAILLALLFVTLPFVIRTVQPVLLELDREMEEAAASLGAGPLRTFRHIVFPNLFPGDPLRRRARLRARDRRVRLGRPDLGNLPFKTEVASVYIFGRIESGDPAGAAAVSVLILVDHVRGAARDRGRATLGHEARPCIGGSSDSSGSSTSLVVLAAPVALVFWRTFEHGLGPAWDAVTTPEAKHAF